MAEELIKKEFIPNSTFISLVQYSYLPNEKGRITEIITVKFHDGGCIEYKPPIDFQLREPYNFETIYDNFMAAPSAGKFWHKSIKGQYQWKRIR